MNFFAKAGGPPGLSRIALLGTYCPRQCGIATFTADLYGSLAEAAPHAQIDVIAVSDDRDKYEYPDEVCFEILQHDFSSYRSAAIFLNAGSYEALCVQHEYGIFGGEAGDMILDLIRAVNMPVFVTLHTVLAKPNESQLRVMQELGRLAASLTVISQKGAELLAEVYGVPESKIEHIHHGVPGPAPACDCAAKRLGIAESDRVLLTFGLISPDKGLEQAIRAMPKIVRQVPNAVYVIAGTTHPQVKKQHGEAYREGLDKLAEELGVRNNVVFLNRFLELSELTEFLSLADIYLTPYLKEEQISSGTLAYALGSGKAVISTPYWYAAELLAEGRGALVPFRDPEAIADAAIGLLTDNTARAEMERKATELGGQMLWSQVSREYLALMESIVRLSASGLRAAIPGSADWHRLVAPSYNLGHLRMMTDETGMLQHAKYTIPDYDEGYSVDDNARALMLAVQLYVSGAIPPDEGNLLLTRYLAFVKHAYNLEFGRFRNFMSYDRRWLENQGSEDSHGRCLWALGFVRNRLPGTAYASVAAALFEDAVKVTTSLRSPRAIAYSLMGVCEVLKSGEDEQLGGYAVHLASVLYVMLAKNRSAAWQWFEPVLSYCNSRMPQALIVAGDRLGRQDLVDAGLKSLDWLCEIQTSSEGLFEPVGSSGVYKRGGQKPIFDQQPVEAHATLSACISAWDITGDAIWRDRALLAFEWFQGFNHLRALICDPISGGCHDGLEEGSINENEGAESMVSWMLSLAEMRAAGLADAYPQELPAYLN